MTLDEWIRYLLIPAIGAGALAALIVTLVVTWREWRDGEWD